MSNRYDSASFEFVNVSAGRSADLFIRYLAERALRVPPFSVLDVGCGRGVRLAEWSKRANLRTLGVDGDYVEQRSLVIPQPPFVPWTSPSRFSLTSDLIRSSASK